MALTAAFDELIATNELSAFCDAYIAAQAMEELALAISGDLSQE